MKEIIILAVPKGSIIRKGDGSTVVLNDVPENALELIEAGATYLMLKKEAKDQLKRLSNERLQNIIKVRKAQNLIHDVSVLELALAEKMAGKNKDAEPLKEKS
ncbi:hypothetical protein [Chryseobacterium sp. MEBOG07]|uniref:hypothetical protein n=1 Tax=Chryseobacterium sp. MEBOG07 TaxID=2879939 RepID=UPI001F2DB4E9|nr:hypothetical protein [Chryseobacterium sp. MEBOG07]UKB81252.1 hypothetical protein LF886_09755 [Chryseobacterium sp. MEBOG07]